MMAGKPSPQVPTTTWHGLTQPALNDSASPDRRGPHRSWESGKALGELR
jgi:hypothetical protein